MVKEFRVRHERGQLFEQQRLLELFAVEHLGGKLFERPMGG